VPTVLLIRHGRSQANTDGVLAGRARGMHLDETGRAQAAAVAARVAAVPLAALVSSPLERCRETARAVATAQPAPARVRSDKRLVECGYGSWTGRELKKLAKEPLWRAVQQHPSAVTFPGGEPMRDMQTRAVSCLRDWDERLAAEHGPEAVWAAVTHGDVVKALVADALGLHLDHFQRIVVDPASVSVITYTPLRPFVVRLNDVGGDLAGLVPPRRRRRRSRGTASSDAPVGGGAGPIAGPSPDKAPSRAAATSAERRRKS
jgi:probable phosphomutase (TIGR03848 family)